MEYIVAMDIKGQRHFFCGWYDSLHNSWGGADSKTHRGVKRFSQDKAEQVASALRGNSTGGGWVTVLAV